MGKTTREKRTRRSPCSTQSTGNEMLSSLVYAHGSSSPPPPPPSSSCVVAVDPSSSLPSLPVLLAFARPSDALKKERTPRCANATHCVIMLLSCWTKKGAISAWHAWPYSLVLLRRNSTRLGPERPAGRGIGCTQARACRDARFSALFNTLKPTCHGKASGNGGERGGHGCPTSHKLFPVGLPPGGTESGTRTSHTERAEA